MLLKYLRKVSHYDLLFTRMKNVLCKVTNFFFSKLRSLKTARKVLSTSPFNDPDIVQSLYDKRSIEKKEEKIYETV